MKKKLLTTKDYRLKTKQGFSLVETLVALFIFSLSITAIIVVTGQGVSDTTIAKNRIIAVALSQEGIEVVRSARDTYALSETNPGEGWDTFTNEMAKNNACGPNGCLIRNFTTFSSAVDIDLDQCDPSPGQFESGCDFLNRELLLTNLSLGFYDYSASNPESPFKRTLYIDCVDSDCKEVRVESLVEWRQGTGIASVNAVEYLFNWFKTVPVTP